MPDRTYVVRIDRPDAPPDFKVYGALPDARKRFVAASARVAEDDFEGAFLFEVPGETDARAAVEMVKSGKAALIERAPWERIVREISESLGDLIPLAGKPNA